MAIIDQVQPLRLYRYRSLEKFSRELDALEQNYLYCAAFTTLNDPMEGVFRSSRTFRESEMGWTPRLRQLNKTLFAVRCKLLDRQDHCNAF